MGWIQALEDQFRPPGPPQQGAPPAGRLSYTVQQALRGEVRPQGAPPADRVSYTVQQALRGEVRPQGAPPPPGHTPSPPLLPRDRGGRRRARSPGDDARSEPTEQQMELIEPARDAWVTVGLAAAAALAVGYALGRR